MKAARSDDGQPAISGQPKAETLNCKPTAASHTVCHRCPGLLPPRAYSRWKATQPSTSICVTRPSGPESWPLANRETVLASPDSYEPLQQPMANAQRAMGKQNSSSQRSRRVGDYELNLLDERLVSDSRSPRWLGRHLPASDLSFRAKRTRSNRIS